MKNTAVLIAFLLLACLLAGCTSSTSFPEAAAQKETPAPDLTVVSDIDDPEHVQTEITETEAPTPDPTEVPETEAPTPDPTEITETEAPNSTEKPDDDPREDELPRLSEMERDELIEKLRELGVDLSDDEIVELCRFNELVAHFEKDPEYDIVSQQPKLNVFFEEVREAVKLYYGDLLPLD